MLQRIHEKLGTAGFIISIVALVAALGGGAYAASGSGLTGKQKKEVEKIAKKYAGKNGTNGANGTNGTNGAPGSPGKEGSQGKQGEQGKAGTNGTNGTNGTSVVSSPEPKGLNCKEGGSKFVAGASTTFACNGESAEYPKTLPSGRTESGTWSVFFTSTVETFPGSVGSITFQLPLASAGSKGFVLTSEDIELEKFGRKAGKSCKVEVSEPLCVFTGCEGTLEEPKPVTAGVLCVYSDGPETTEEHTSGPLQTRQANGEELGYSTSGALLAGPFIQGTTAEPAIFDARGTWAIKAP